MAEDSDMASVTDDTLDEFHMLSNSEEDDVSVLSSEENDVTEVYDSFNDEYGFPVASEYRSEYDKWQKSNERRKNRLLSKEPWKDAKITMRTKPEKLKELIKAGIPSSEQRTLLWGIVSGAYQKKTNANANCETNNYYTHLLSVRHTVDSYILSEIEKDVTRTFPGHHEFETQEGQDKIQRILEAFAKRSESIGYCQSMNFIAGMAILIMKNEEDAFWLLTSIVEDHSAGKYSRAMIELQVDNLVLEDLLSEKLPDLKVHMNRYSFDSLIVATKWFMCLFIGTLPTETLLRIWDMFFLQGPRVLFRAAIALLILSKEDLLKSRDPMEFWGILQQRCQSLFDHRKLLRAMNKLTEITNSSIDEMRSKYRSQFIKTKEKEVEPAPRNMQRKNSIDMVMRNINDRLDSFYAKYIAKKQKDTKDKPYSLPSNVESLVVDCLQKHIKHPIDVIVTGTGARLFPDGKKFHGNFINGMREGKGVLVDKEGKMEYSGYWKNDKREGRGLFTDNKGTTYNGDFRNDVFNGRGILKCRDPRSEYDGDWVNGKREGKGVMKFSNYDMYEGDWKDNRRNGHGSYIWSSGTIYEGGWKDDKPDGKGTLTFCTGDKYSGEFKNGKREGNGFIMYINGDSYDGQWKDDKLDGTGIYKYENEETGASEEFEGSFKCGFRIENGVKLWPNGATYVEPAVPSTTLVNFIRLSGQTAEEDEGSKLRTLQYRTMDNFMDSVTLQVATSPNPGKQEEFRGRTSSM